MPNRVPYAKSPLTYSGQVEILKSRGLLIEDEIKAEHLLKNISYYLLSEYWYPMLAYPKSEHRFKPGVKYVSIIVVSNYRFGRLLHRSQSNERYLFQDKSCSLV
jgi:abortive infection bacteriophage resistance protein